MTSPGLPVAAVARRLGVAPATLRTWARRYGLEPSDHAAGLHRRYSHADVSRLEVMRRLTQQGVAPAEAARHALDADVVAGAVSPHLGSGGNVLAMPGASAAVRGLGRAAMALDGEAVTAAVRTQIAERGVIATWNDVLRPVLAAAGERWATTGTGVEVEHLLSDCLTSALRQTTWILPTVAPARPVLLASAPDELHALPLHAVAAGLAERGMTCRVLGAAMPVSALEAALKRTGACALFLWSQNPRTGRAEMFADLPVTRPPTDIVVGGPGWNREELPDRVSYAEDLTSALDLVARASGR